MEFGYRLRELRKEKGYGLREFAKILKKSPSYLSNIERGSVTPPSAEIVLEMAKILDADQDELLALAKRFDVESFEEIRKHAGRLESAEKTIKFLSSAISLDETDHLGGFGGILEIIVGEKILNPDAGSITDSFHILQFILDTAGRPADPEKMLAINLRREIAQQVFIMMNETIHPYANYRNLEEPSLQEKILETMNRYPRELVEEVTKREDLKEAYRKSRVDEPE